MPSMFKQTPSNFPSDDLSNPQVDVSDSNVSMESDVEPQASQDVIDIQATPTDQSNQVQQSSQKPNQKKNRRFSLGKIISLGLIVISIGLLSVGAYTAYSIAKLNGQAFGQGQDQDLLSQLGQLGSFLNPNHRVELKGEKEGRTNFLLIGKDATGPGLTDTIMIGSYYYKEKKFVTVNIPRDFYVYDGYGSYKINALYPYAEGRQAGSGEQVLSDFLSKEFEIDIHYWVATNFQGLKQLIDTLNGVDVNVDSAFTDCLYPTDNYSGYVRPCPSFEVGRQHMDGRVALQYARSRETTSDFDRSRRQSIVVQSILEKAKEQNLFESASKINSYLDILGKNIRTSLRLDEMVSLAQVLKDTDIANSFLRSEWQTGNGFLCPGTSDDGAYLIWYCGGQIAGRKGTSPARETARSFVQNLLPKTELSELFSSSVVFLGNQSTETSKAYDAFSSSGFEDLKINNAYTKIAKATSSSVEDVTIYITDPKIKDLFDKMDPKPDVPLTIQTTIPADRVVPTAYKDAKIIVWVASKDSATPPK